MHPLFLLQSDAMRKNGEMDQAIEVLEELVRIAPRVEHQIMYADYLAREKRTEEARGVLENAVEEYKHAPRFQQRRDRAAVAEARRRLRQL